MNFEYLTHSIVLLIIIFGVLMIAAPQFPNSEVSEQNNKNAFLSLTIVGSFITLVGVYAGWSIFKKTTMEDFKEYFNPNGSFMQLGEPYTEY